MLVLFSGSSQVQSRKTWALGVPFFQRVFGDSLKMVWGFFGNPHRNGDFDHDKLLRPVDGSLL